MTSNFKDQWDQGEIENLSYCPICKSKDNKKLYENLEDKAFFCAPGKWILYKCENCISIYLNPRPNRQSIVKAYSNYFTHQDSKEYNLLPTFEKARTLFANGYRNWKYGTNY